MNPCMSGFDPRRWVSFRDVSVHSPSWPHLQGSHFLIDTGAEHTERTVAVEMCSFTETFECLLSPSVTRSAFRKATALLTIEPVMSSDCIWGSLSPRPGTPVPRA